MRISQTTDYSLLAALNKTVHDVHAKLYPTYFKAYNYEEIRGFFRKNTAKESFMFLLLEDDRLPLGYAWIEFKEYPENAFKKAYTSVYVHQLSVSENDRQKGYGSALMEAITEIAKANGIQKIELDYWCDNKVAKCFYEKNDFVKHQEFVYKDITV